MHADIHAQNARLSLRLLAEAPHRLLFFIGASNVLLAMAWWALWLSDRHWQLGLLASPKQVPGWMHAIVMQYQVLPPFMFGFLLTVFPRWMGLAEFTQRHYAPVGIGLFGGQLFVLSGMAFGFDVWVKTGIVMTTAGWSYGGMQLLGVLLAERRLRKGPTWHAWSCWSALFLGFLGLCAVLVHLYTHDARAIMLAIKIGTFGLLLPIYFSVAHRMFPFFAGNVVKDYVPWRPLWLLAVMWSLALLHLLLEISQGYTWLWIADTPLTMCSAFMLWRWWPRNRAPGLLWVIFAGFSWLPVAFALYSAQSFSTFIGMPLALGRGPAHALFIGFFGSVLVAMVTRVTQGHSGQLLLMPAVAWFAFIALQLVALLRIVSEMMPYADVLQVVAAWGWLLAFIPWVLRSLRIYLRPRTDGKPG